MFLHRRCQSTRAAGITKQPTAAATKRTVVPNAKGDLPAEDEPSRHTCQKFPILLAVNRKIESDRNPGQSDQ